MTASHGSSLPLVSVLWPAQAANRWLRLGLLAFAGSAVLAVSSKINVPLWPVPITMQTFALLVIAGAFGSRLAVATVLLFLAEGLAGLPVFAGANAGPAVLAGPTGGYLIGWIAAAWIIGRLAERGFDRRFATTALAMLAGNAVIYLFGLPWLARFVPWDQVLMAGLVPFLIGDGAKLLLAAIALPTAWRLIGRQGTGA